MKIVYYSLFCLVFLPQIVFSEETQQDNDSLRIKLSECLQLYLHEDNNPEKRLECFDKIAMALGQPTPAEQKAATQRCLRSCMSTRADCLNTCSMMGGEFVHLCNHNCYSDESDCLRACDNNNN